MKLLRKSLAIILLIALMVTPLAGFQSPTPVYASEGQTYKAGTYTTSAPGKNGDISVSVTFSANKIENVTIAKHQETPGISDPALDRIPKAIVADQSLAVDAVTGATMTSDGILKAVENAVVKAGGNVAALKVKVATQKKTEKIEKTADVIVIGGGGAGITAAASAAENGAKVILIEKAAALGGNTLVSGFAWNAVDPEIQGKMDTMPGQVDTLKGILALNEKDFGKFKDTLIALKKQINTYLSGDTSKMFDSIEFHMIQAYLGGKRQDKAGNWIEGNYDLVKTLVTNSLPTYKWVQSFGGKFSDKLSAPVGAMWTRGHNPVDKKSIFDVMSNYLVKTVNNSSEIMLETKATSLITDNGKVVGVKAVKTDGTEVTLHANRGVIMATGGYGANAKLCAEYNNYWPSIPLDMKTTNASTSTGDGIIMGREIGANLIGMAFTQLMPTSNEKTGALTDALLVAPQNYVFVNKQGKRFVNEYAERDVLSFAALKQTNGVFYTIADQPMALTSQDRKTQAMIDKLVADKLIYKADTLEGLADIIGCDRATFVNEIKKYNSYVDKGADPEFHKNVFQMKVEKGPFYACPAKPAIHHTMGGLQINSDAQVLNTYGSIIPGLYAAGEVTGGIHAGNRLGGNAIADIFVFGRIAGESAASNK